MSSSGSSSGRPGDTTGTEAPASSVEAAKRPEDKKAAAPCTEFDDAYFRYYANVGVHEDMIKDGVRTGTYRDAIMHHQKYIAGKVVVDVGCGTGILSIFCAQAGAKRVYAVEASDIAVQAKEVVKANNLADNIIVLHGRVEDVEIDEEVDAIISEWMGHMLLFKSMLESVITARDRWLKPGGLILPSHASLDIAPITNPSKYRNRVDFWRDVYGIDMSAMMPLAKECAFEEPLVERIKPENLISWSDVILDVDCYKVKLQELEPRPAKFKFSSKMRAPLHGFAFWFDFQFRGPKTVPSNCNSSDLPENDPPVLSTDPEKPQTHWQQTLIYLKDPLEVKLDQVIEGSVTLSRNKENHHFMNVRIEYTTGGQSFVRESVMRCSAQEALLVRK